MNPPQENNLPTLFSLGRGCQMRRPSWAGFSMEEMFWAVLDNICRIKVIAPHDFIESAKRQQPGHSISTAVRIQILNCLDQQCASSLMSIPLPQARGPGQNGCVQVPALASVGLRVLVVDDVAMNREVANSFLRAAGHDVTCVEGGAEAVAAVKIADFDVILMDVRMPEMDGFEATRRIRALKGKRGRLPIVALTALAFPEQVAECRAAGMDSHLPKPFNPDTLLKAVLSAKAAERTVGVKSSLESTTVVTLGASDVPASGSDLLIFNPSTFRRTVRYLAPDAASSYLKTISQRGEALLRALEEIHSVPHHGDELAEAAHSLVGSAGMFGFERLTATGRNFGRAVHNAPAVAPDLAEDLSVALKDTLSVIHDKAPLELLV